MVDEVKIIELCAQFDSIDFGFYELFFERCQCVPVVGVISHQGHIFRP